MYIYIVYVRIHLSIINNGEGKADINLKKERDAFSIDFYYAVASLTEVINCELYTLLSAL